MHNQPTLANVLRYDFPDSKLRLHLLGKQCGTKTVFYLYHNVNNIDVNEGPFTIGLDSNGNILCAIQSSVGFMWKDCYEAWSETDKNTWGSNYKFVVKNANDGKFTYRYFSVAKNETMLFNITFKEVDTGVLIEIDNDVTEIFRR